MKRSKTKLLIEASLMIALATVLSVFKFVELPYGGSVTMASMMPILILSYRNGIGWGLSGGLVYAIVQQLLGLKNLSYFTSWQSVVAIILLDYLLAFTFSGLCGIFRTKKISQRTSFVLGACLACVARYVCHTISGATVWAGLSIPDSAALVYSLGYNATYMIPETLVLIGAVYYVGGVMDFTRELPVRIIQKKEGNARYGLKLLLGAALLAGFITDVVLIAPKLQNAETGMFDVGGLGTVNWLAVIIVSSVSVILAAAAFVANAIINKKELQK